MRNPHDGHDHADDADDEKDSSGEDADANKIVNVDPATVMKEFREAVNASLNQMRITVHRFYQIVDISVPHSPLFRIFLMAAPLLLSNPSSTPTQLHSHPPTLSTATHFLSPRITLIGRRSRCCCLTCKSQSPFPVLLASS